MNIVRRQAAPATEGMSRWDPFQAMRDIMRWDPFREIWPLRFEEGRESVFSPDVDVKEVSNAYVFQVDLPGVKEADVEVSFTGNRLTLTGRRHEEHREEGESYFTMERSWGSFTRSFTLPPGTDAEKAKAELKDGVLTIEVPKRPEVQARKIALSGNPKGTLSGGTGGAMQTTGGSSEGEGMKHAGSGSIGGASAAARGSSKG